MTGNTPRVAIFGGSFDPVHRAHVALATFALTALSLDELCWVPAGQPWQKTRELAPAAHREAMLRLAIEGEPRFTLSRCELTRPGASYTVDTVRLLQAARPGAHWYLLIGQDQYASFHTWHGWQDLLGLVTVAVANRLDASPADDVLADDALAHAARVDDALVLQVPHEAVALPMMDVSSTDIRTRIAHGLPVDDLVPPSVARYIELHGLYRTHPHRLDRDHHPTRS